MRIIGLVTITSDSDSFAAWARETWLPGLGALVSVQDVELLSARPMSAEELGSGTPADHVLLLTVTDMSEFQRDTGGEAGSALTAGLCRQARVTWLTTERLPA